MISLPAFFPFRDYKTTKLIVRKKLRNFANQFFSKNVESENEKNPFSQKKLNLTLTTGLNISNIKENYDFASKAAVTNFQQCPFIFPKPFSFEYFSLKISPFSEKFLRSYSDVEKFSFPANILPSSHSKSQILPFLLMNSLFLSPFIEAEDFFSNYSSSSFKKSGSWNQSLSIVKESFHLFPSFINLPDPLFSEIDLGKIDVFFYVYIIFSYVYD
jgi:hypothetical protein